MLKVVGASWFQTVMSFLIVVGILLFGVLINIICRTQNHEDDGKYAATVSWNPETEQFDIELLGQNNDPKSINRGIARAYYQPDMQKTGWAILEIETDGRYPDEDQAYAAGILEGSLSWQHIYWQWKNTIKHVCDGKKQFCTEIRSFLEHNTATIRKKAKANDRTDPFWHQVNLFYTQLAGIEFGWKYEVRRNKQSYEIPFLDFLWLNIASDMKDFQKMAFSSNNNSYNHSPAAMTLLKLISSNETKFLLAHASSGFYSSMLRVQKKYEFHYRLTGRSNSEPVPGRTISFTSYPGAIHSQDDFYQIQINDGSAVTVTGTALLTIDWNDEQKKNDYQVLLGPRIMAGNRLSRSGKIWGYNVGRHQSGTGNKQWLHIRTKNDHISLWVLEQTPQKITSKDETELLHKQGYWISCGIPYYKRGNEIKIDSGEITQHHTGNVPLKNIMQVLREGQQNVSDIHSLINLMRGPELAISGRADLHESIVSHPAVNSAASNSNKQNKSTSRNSLQDTKSSAHPSHIQNYMKFPNSDSNMKHNFSLIYNSSWLNLFNLKNDVLLTSIPKEKRSPGNVQPSVRHNTIVGLQRTEFESKSLTVNRVKRIPGETNSNINRSSGYSSLTIDGVIDLKLTDTNDKFLAVAGPPFNLKNKLKTIEPFQWSKSPINYLPHDGQADIWKYEPVEANFVWD